MSQFIEFDPAKQPRYKIELHVHLDGSVRLTTVWELAKKKGIDLKVETLEGLYDECSIKGPSTLAKFLKPFSIIEPCIVGDPLAIERIAYEYCEDAVSQGILYAEVRYCPHLFSSMHGVTGGGQLDPLTPREVVMCVNRGLSRGA
ncbi:Adenosine deaminase, partial [Stegodyphus mimosarum]